MYTGRNISKARGGSSVSTTQETPRWPPCALKESHLHIFTNPYTWHTHALPQVVRSIGGCFTYANRSRGNTAQVGPELVNLKTLVRRQWGEGEGGGVEGRREEGEM